MGYSQRLFNQKQNELLKQTKDPVPVSCKGKTKQGKPCKNECVKGTEFCKVHGEV
jgi:hypothetical protein